MMNRKNFAVISGVIIDLCKDHGIWFDYGELEIIMNFIARGGLQTAKAKEISELLEFQFGVVKYNGLWNFQSAKTLVFYCNGPWCGQSPTNIRALLALGYPASKLKWYRGGMQAWKSLGLTTVQP